MAWIHVHFKSFIIYKFSYVQLVINCSSQRRVKKIEGLKVSDSRFRGIDLCGNVPKIFLLKREKFVKEVCCLM